MVKNKLILVVGFATFFFGFGGTAILNIYLLATNSPLVLQFRSSLMFISAIIGDGIILPIVNMVAVSFLFAHNALISRFKIVLSLFLGLLITIYFHVVQGVQTLVNWSMPIPWHWNFLGFWHAVYMFSVVSLLCLFYIILFIAFKRNKKPIKETVFVGLGLLLFFILLGLDYL